MHSQDQQILATHTAYAAMFGKLLHTLVHRGVIHPMDGAAVLRFGRESLAESGISGDLIDVALDGMDTMADAITPTLRGPKSA